MTVGPLDKVTSSLAGKLARLPPISFALFFAYVAERLIDLYAAFEKKHHWGDSNELRRQLDTVWKSLMAGNVELSPDSLGRLETLAPDGEKYDAPDSTYAQDAVIAVDAAVRALLGQDLKGEWIEYAIESTKTRVWIALTGYSSDDSNEVQSRLLADCRMSELLQDYEYVIAALEGFSPARVRELRHRASSSRLSAREYLGI